MVSVREAKHIILESTQTTASEKIQLLDAIDRILAEDIISDNPMPLFDNSSMDGYAVMAENTKDACEHKSLALEVIDVLLAGQTTEDGIRNNTAIKIMTGTKVPGGANAVIPIENVFAKEKKIYLTEPIMVGENIRKKGSEVRVGDKVITAGHKLGASEIGVLAAFNRKEVEVYKKPKVAVLITGDEILELGDKAQEGKIWNSNSYALWCQIRKYGGEPQLLGIAKDSKNDIKEKLSKIEEADITIVSGGVSVGDCDYTKEIFEEMQVEEKFWKISMKPGKPLYFGTKGAKLFFGLPGNPVSTMLAVDEFVAPAMCKMQNIIYKGRAIVTAELRDSLEKQNDGRTHYIRANYDIVNGRFVVSPLSGLQNSSALLGMSRANCLIVMPDEKTRVAKGDMVEIQIMNFNGFNV